MVMPNGFDISEGLIPGGGGGTPVDLYRDFWGRLYAAGIISVAEYNAGVESIRGTFNVEELPYWAVATSGDENLIRGTLRQIATQKQQLAERGEAKERAKVVEAAWQAEQKRIATSERIARHAQRATAATRRPFPEPQAPYQYPAMPSAGKIYEPFLEGMPPRMKGYFEQQIGEIYREFEEQDPGARGRWWRALNPPPQPQQLGGVSREEVARTLRYAQQAAEMGLGGAEFGGGREPETAYEQYVMGMAQAYPSLARQYQERGGAEDEGISDIEMGQIEARRQTDPWLAYLQRPQTKEAFKQKWYGKPPRERGVRTGRYAPPTRWGGW